MSLIAIKKGGVGMDKSHAWGYLPVPSHKHVPLIDEATVVIVLLELLVEGFCLHHGCVYVMESLLCVFIIINSWQADFRYHNLLGSFPNHILGPVGKGLE